MYLWYCPYCNFAAHSPTEHKDHRCAVTTANTNGWLLARDADDDAATPPTYKLVCLEEATEEQLVFAVAASEYATICHDRDRWKERGWLAHIRFADDAAVWDYLQANVAADVCAAMGWSLPQ